MVTNKTKSDGHEPAGDWTTELHSHLKGLCAKEQQWVRNQLLRHLLSEFYDAHRERIAELMRNTAAGAFCDEEPCL